MAAEAWLGFTVEAEAYYWLQETRFRRAGESGETRMVLYLSTQHIACFLFAVERRRWAH